MYKLLLTYSCVSGFKKVRKIIDAKRPWSCLFEPVFFFTYPYYYSITVVCRDEKVFQKFRSRFESRVRIYAKSCQDLNNVKYVHINCQAFDRGVGDPDEDYVKKWFIGVQMDQPDEITESDFSKMFSDSKTPEYKIYLKFFRRL